MTVFELLTALVGEYGTGAGMAFLIGWNVYHHVLGQFNTINERLERVETNQAGLSRVVRALSRETEGVNAEAVDEEIADGEETYHDLFNGEAEEPKP